MSHGGLANYQHFNPSKVGWGQRGWFYRIEIEVFLTDLVLSLQIVSIGPSKCEMNIFFVVWPKQDGWRQPSWISEKLPPTEIKRKFASFWHAKLFVGTRLITWVCDFGHFVIFKMAASDWLIKHKPLCRDITGNHRAPKMVRMSSSGHFDADLVIFECRNISNMADGGHLGFRKDVRQLK